jgi:hypothetical protein
MSTEWLKNFSHETKENFENNTKPEIKVKPPILKSVYLEPTDARNMVEPLETIGGSGFDNIKGLTLTKTEATKKTNDTSKTTNPGGSNKDEKILGEMTIALVTSFVSFYLAYNLYFNLTVDDSKLFEIEKKLDNIPMKPATNWFVEIVKNVTTWITTSIPTRIKTFIDGNSYFKYRSIFVLFLILGNIYLKPVIKNIIRFFEGLVKQKKNTVFKYIFGYKNNNKLISILFFFFLTKALYTMFLEEGGGPIVSFIVANPILFLIGLFVYVVVLYPITVPLSTFAVTCLLFFYCFVSMVYFYFTEKFDTKSPYANVTSFSELLAAINNHLNFGPVIMENQNNKIEKLFAFLLNDIHYLYFIGVFASIIPIVMKIQSSVLKTYLFVLVGAIIGLLSISKYSGLGEIFEKIKNSIVSS